MSNIYSNPKLIDFNYFAEYSPVPTNYNWEDIKPFVTIAEEIWVVDIIGRALYNELLEQITNNEITGENSTLLLKIYPYLSMAIVFESLPFIAFHISEKGITAGKSDNSEPISSSELTNMQNHIRTELEVLKSMLKKWLNEHAECYPLYNSDTNDCNCNLDDCSAFALFAWGTERLSINEQRNLKWYAFYNNLRHNPNSNLRMYSNKNNILFRI